PTAGAETPAARTGLRSQRVERLLPSRPTAARRRIPRGVRRLLRGRGPVLSHPRRRIQHLLRTRVARLASRVVVVRQTLSGTAGAAGPQRRAGALAQLAARRPAAGAAVAPRGAGRQGLAALAPGRAGTVLERPAERGDRPGGHPPAQAANAPTKTEYARMGRRDALLGLERRVTGRIR